MAEHNTLTGSNLHEPKGAATATLGQVYVSNGAGSGVWTDAITLNEAKLTTVFADVSTAETIYLAIPYAGIVTKVVTVLEGALATANDTITVKDSTGLSMGTLTITEAGSAAGDVDVLLPVANNVVGDNDFITIESDGASTSARRLWVTVVLQRT